ncbi:alpha/beta hydrolase [Carboxylicivirga marina]|uniref:Alpha/beta hydrolase n=1 Tax=Carboxylicivirga marina TaxID=2800988 RepID=A0ABS1HIF2_9BACT|nr:alpha/beta hydrolase-fold protein [Carboxylicivirga marina]MBK3517449.1 alpha/beta hydrolase [Carboxylicivirga marina]
MRQVLFLIFLSTFACMHAQKVKVSSGKVVRHELFDSEYVDARNVDVWLPEGYCAEKQYAVIYMHDGQMLFDASSTWNKQEWGVDEVMSELMKTKRIRDCIVVGIWNNDGKRNAEYFPQRAWEMQSKERQKEILSDDKVLNNPAGTEHGLLANDYLRFIVRELKPFIDAHYSTKSAKTNTFIMGSSMGGLISAYAICEYPGVFGGAICMSTHWPAADGVVLAYIKDNLPNPDTHKIYFDYGTATLDALYEPYQLKVDKMMVERGYKKEKNFKSDKFEGEPHTEEAWNKRLHIPLAFMLK